MKRWEEQQRKKLYNNRISQAKPTLVTQARKPGAGTRTSTASNGQTRSGIMSAGSQNYGSSSDDGFGGGPYMPTGESQQVLLQSPGAYSVSNPYGQFQTPVAASGGLNLMEIGSAQSNSQKRQDLPIFQLLKAFKLQQYASKLSEVGYGQDIYKLALLGDSQRIDLISQLKVLPGHKAKLMSLFDVIDELYPKKVVTEQLKQFTPQSNINKNMKQTKRVQSAAYGFRQLHTFYHQQRSGQAQKGGNLRSLINQYEALDPQTKQAFNNTFLMNLESVKYSIPQLFQQHFNPADRSAAINSIFPPQHYYNPINTTNDSWGPVIGTQSGYDTQEIQQLVTKYAGRAPTGGQNGGSAQNRAGSNSANRLQVQENEKHLKQEMAHTMKVIERINREFEQITRSSQQDYDDIRSNPVQRQYTRQSTSISQQNMVDTSSSSQSYKRKLSITSKPQSVQQARRAQLPASITKPSKQPQQSVAQQETGRFLSNRQIAKQKQMMHPRVITEHEVASEMTTPSKLGNRDRSLGKNTSQNVSAVGLVSGMKLTQSGFKNLVQQPISSTLGDVESALQDQGILNIVPLTEVSQDGMMDVEEEIPPFIEAEESKYEEEFIEDTTPEKQVPYNPPKERKLSPLLEREERDLLWNNVLGHSLDTKQVTSALGYLDLKQICLCLAHALNRHIQFSQGFYFLDDLQEQIKALHLEEHLKLDFSYELDPKMRIELPNQQQKKQNDDTKREFEELKNKMATGKQPFDYQESLVVIGKQASLSEEDQFDRASAGVVEEEEEYGVEQRSPQAALHDEEYIQDYYGNNTGNTLEKNQQMLNQVINELVDDCPEGGEEGLDLDYSYSHLEDFLRSHRNNNTVIHTGSVVSHGAQHHSSSKAQQNTTTTQQLMNTFLTSYNKNKGNGLPSARASIIAPVESIPERKAADESGGSSDCIIKPVPVACDQSQSSDGSIRIDVRTKEGFKDLLRFQMRIFDCNYDFETDQLIDAPLPEDNPTLEELYYYCKYVIISGRMEKEIPILCLVYIERFLSKTGILMNHLNWKRLTMICLCLASKIWDDDSLENVHFPKVMPDITLKEIASLEKVLLQFLDFDLILRGAEYAKYYFVLKTFAQESGFNSCLPPVGPLTAQKMSDLQNNTAKVESELRDKYEVKLSLQKTM